MTFLPLSLKTRIALSTVAIATVFSAGIALASLYFAQRDVRQALQDQQDSIVELAVKQLDTSMNDRITLLEHVAAQLSGHLDEGPARLRELAQRSVPVPASFDGVVVADAQGRVLTRSGELVGIGDRDYFLELARTLQPVVSAPLRARERQQRRAGQRPHLVARRRLPRPGGRLARPVAPRISWWSWDIAASVPAATIAWCPPAGTRSTCSIRTAR